MNIGSRLKQILAEKEMTVSQLSRESGIPAQTLYAMINRDSNKADMDIMAKMLIALDMDFMEFMGQEWKAAVNKPKQKKQAARVQPVIRQNQENQGRRGELESWLL